MWFSCTRQWKWPNRSPIEGSCPFVDILNFRLATRSRKTVLNSIKGHTILSQFRVTLSFALILEFITASIYGYHTNLRAFVINEGRKSIDRGGAHARVFAWCSPRFAPENYRKWGRYLGYLPSPARSRVAILQCNAIVNCLQLSRNRNTGKWQPAQHGLVIQVHSEKPVVCIVLSVVTRLRVAVYDIWR